MTETRYPNESAAYRDARNALLEEEKALIDKVRAVSAQRRALPLGGKVDKNYLFVSANDADLGTELSFPELFGDKNTLLFYTFMYGPQWDKPCPSCTSLIDSFDRASRSVKYTTAFAVVARAPAEKLNAWAKERGWADIRLVSAENTDFLRDYLSITDDDDKTLQPIMHVFTRSNSAIHHFWASEMRGNHVDMIWPYWNLMDLTPEGRPNRMTPPQDFRSEYLEEHYL